MIKLGFSVVVAFLTFQARAEEPAICANLVQTESRPFEREKLLTETKAELVSGAQQSVRNLTAAKEYLTSCRSEACEVYQQEFIKVLNDQLYVSKILKAIIKKSNVTRSRRARTPLGVRNVLDMIEKETLTPENIASFNTPGFNYTDADKRATLALWTNVFIRMVDRCLQNRA